MGKIFPEILNLCESRKFCDDPASRSANWDQVNKIFSQFQRNLSISKIFFWGGSPNSQLHFGGGLASDQYLAIFQRFL